MTITFNVFLFILITHWLGDFVLQTDQQAKGKSKSLKCLLAHTITYSLFWILPLLFYRLFSIWSEPSNLDDFLLPIMKFVLYTFAIHTAQDYITSRINAKLWAKGDVHNFFVSIGLSPTRSISSRIRATPSLNSWPSSPSSSRLCTA